MSEEKEVFGNFSSLQISKEDLLKVLEENRAKHNALFNASLSGYYVAVENSYKECLKTLPQEIKTIKEYGKYLETGYNNYQYGKPAVVAPVPRVSIVLKSVQFPVSYEDSYNSAIRRVQLSLYDKFSLNDSEYNQYILNNWSWKSSFVNLTSNYLGNTFVSVTGCYGTGINLIALSGCVSASTF